MPRAAFFLRKKKNKTELRTRSREEIEQLRDQEAQKWLNCSGPEALAVLEQRGLQGTPLAAEFMILALALDAP